MLQGARQDPGQEASATVGVKAKRSTPKCRSAGTWSSGRQPGTAADAASCVAANARLLPSFRQLPWRQTNCTSTRRFGSKHFSKAAELLCCDCGQTVTGAESPSKSVVIKATARPRRAR